MAKQKHKSKYAEAKAQGKPMPHTSILKAGIKLMRIGEFIEKYHPNVKQNTIRYNMWNGKIDYVVFGKENLIVVTKKTLAYVPNLDKRRKV